jgi:hypothetical protein
MNAPKQATWVVAVIIAAIAVLEEFDIVNLELQAYTFHMMIISVILFALGTTVKGM